MAQAVLPSANSTNSVSAWCSMATLTKRPSGGNADLAPDVLTFVIRSEVDAGLEDLIHSWHRLENQDLRRLAVRLIRSLSEE